MLDPKVQADLIEALDGELDTTQDVDAVYNLAQYLLKPSTSGPVLSNAEQRARRVMFNLGRLAERGEQDTQPDYDNYYCDYCTWGSKWRDGDYNCEYGLDTEGEPIMLIDIPREGKPSDMVMFPVSRCTFCGGNLYHNLATTPDNLKEMTKIVPEIQH